MNTNHCRGLSIQLKTVLSAIAIITLAACGQRPPDCTSQETTALVKQVVKQDVQAMALAAATRGVPQSLRPYWEKLVARYADGLNVEVGEIVSNGYDSGAKKYSCEGKIAFTTATSDSAQVRSSFSSQAVATGKGEFLVVVDQSGAIARAVLDDFVQFARAEAVREDQQDKKPVAEGQQSSVSKESASVSEDAPSAQAPSQLQPESAKLPRQGEVPAAAAAPTTTPQVAKAAPIASLTVEPSFDCAKASTPAERLICSTPNLADADAKLAAAYRETMGRTLDKDAVRSAQATWRRTVRDACGDAACMLGAYQHRITQLGEAK